MSETICERCKRVQPAIYGECQEPCEMAEIKASQDYVGQSANTEAYDDKIWYEIAEGVADPEREQRLREIYELLTPAEKEVYSLLAIGRTYKEIAGIRKVTPNAIRWLASNIRKKTL